MEKSNTVNEPQTSNMVVLQRELSNAIVLLIQQQERRAIELQLTTRMYNTTIMAALADAMALQRFIWSDVMGFAAEDFDNRIMSAIRELYNVTKPKMKARIGV